MMHSSDPSTIANCSTYKIYDPLDSFEIQSADFNAITIALVADQKSDLNWNKAFLEADEALKNNLKIFWDLKLGLFDKLHSPLSNQQQFLTLKLAIEHFNTTIWSKYSNNSIGVCLYSGSAQFNTRYKWGEKETENFTKYLSSQSLKQTDLEIQSLDDLNPNQLLESTEGKRQLALFSQHMAIDYIKLLAELLAEDAEPFALIDLSPISSLIDQARWQEGDFATPLRFAFKGSRIPLNHQLAWKEGSSPLGYIGSIPLEIESTSSPIALWLPSNAESNSAWDSSLERILSQLHQKQVHYRLIFDDKLIIEWHQLDHLIVLSQSITPKAKRMLQGFAAAGGIVIHAGEPLGVNSEVSFIEFFGKEF